MSDDIPFADIDDIKLDEHLDRETFHWITPVYLYDPEGYLDRYDRDQIERDVDLVAISQQGIPSPAVLIATDEEDSHDTLDLADTLHPETVVIDDDFDGYTRFNGILGEEVQGHFWTFLDEAGFQDRVADHKMTLVEAYRAAGEE
jgi:hypothetical protein